MSNRKTLLLLKDWPRDPYGMGTAQREVSEKLPQG